MNLLTKDLGFSFAANSSNLVRGFRLLSYVPGRSGGAWTREEPLKLDKHLWHKLYPGVKAIFGIPTRHYPVPK